jgi:preprotein translocase subunit SecD
MSARKLAKLLAGVVLAAALGCTSSEDQTERPPDFETSGGLFMLLETHPGHRAEVCEKLEARFDEFDIRGAIVEQEGDSQIIVRLPGFEDVAAARRLVRRGFMAWMLVGEELLLDPAYAQDKLLELYERVVRELPDSGPDPDRPDRVVAYKDETGDLVSYAVFDRAVAEDDLIPPGTILRIYTDEDRPGKKIPEALLLRSSEERPYIIGPDDLERESCVVRTGAYDQPVVAFEIGTDEGKRRFREVTTAYSAESDKKIAVPGSRSYRGWRVAILVDDEVLSAPSIRQPLSSGGVITGIGTSVEAKVLALQLRTGPLPPGVRVVECRLVPPAAETDQEGAQ